MNRSDGSCFQVWSDIATINTALKMKEYLYSSETLNLKKNTFHYNSSKYYSVNWNILIGKYSFVIVNLVETGILYLSYVAFPITFIQIKVDSRLCIV